MSKDNKIPLTFTLLIRLSVICMSFVFNKSVKLFYLKMADDASSSSGCAGNLIDNSINQDELIMKQQREIEKEVTDFFYTFTFTLPLL